MFLIVCIDSRGGMSFGGRRQSRDRILQKRLLDRVGTSHLFMSPYSAKLFQEAQNVIATENYLEKIGPGDYVFVEDGPLPKSGVEGLFLYHWNRLYPADRYFTLSPAALGLTRLSREEFPGSSHDVITEEIFSLNKESL